MRDISDDWNVLPAVRQRRESATNQTSEIKELHDAPKGAKEHHRIKGTLREAFVEPLGSEATTVLLAPTFVAKFLWLIYHFLMQNRQRRSKVEQNVSINRDKINEIATAFNAFRDNAASTLTTLKDELVQIKKKMYIEEAVLTLNALEHYTDSQFEDLSHFVNHATAMINRIIISARESKVSVELSSDVVEMEAAYNKKSSRKISLTTEHPVLYDSEGSKFHLSFQPTWRDSVKFTIWEAIPLPLERHKLLKIIKLDTDYMAVDNGDNAIIMSHYEAHKCVDSGFCETGKLQTKISGDSSCTLRMFQYHNDTTCEYDTVKPPRTLKLYLETVVVIRTTLDYNVTTTCQHEDILTNRTDVFYIPDNCLFQVDEDYPLSGGLSKGANLNHSFDFGGISNRTVMTFKAVLKHRSPIVLPRDFDHIYFPTTMSPAITAKTNMTLFGAVTSTRGATGKGTVILRNMTTTRSTTTTAAPTTTAETSLKPIWTLDLEDEEVQNSTLFPIYDDIALLPNITWVEKRSPFSEFFSNIWDLFKDIGPDSLLNKLWRIFIVGMAILVAFLLLIGLTFLLLRRFMDGCIRL